MNMVQACEQFLGFCENVRHLSPHTIRAYRLDLRRFAACVGPGVPITAFDRATIHAYVEALFTTFHLRASSVKRHIASARALFRWLEDEGRITEDPFRRARVKIATPKRLPRLLTRAELRAVLGTPASGDFNDLTSQVAIELLFATGVRVAELAALRDEDVDTETGAVMIIGKGDRQRRVFLPENVLGLVQRYRSERQAHAQTPIFLVTERGKQTSPDIIRRLVRSRAEHARVTRRITPHMFRHSVATYL